MSQLRHLEAGRFHYRRERCDDCGKVRDAVVRTASGRLCVACCGTRQQIDTRSIHWRITLRGQYPIRDYEFMAPIGGRR